MKPVTHVRILVVACWIALFALGLMVWSLLDPRPIPVILAMSVAQILGTASLAALLVVVVDDVRRSERIPDSLRPRRSQPPPKQSHIPPALGK